MLQTKLTAALAATSEMDSLRAKLIWHQNIRDWVASSGFKHCVHLGKDLPEWVILDGRRLPK